MGLGLGQGVSSPSYVNTFQLSDISSLTAWFKKGEGITTDGGNVSRWVSQVGDFCFGQNTSGKQPVHDALSDVIQFTSARQLDLGTANFSTQNTITSGVNNDITVCIAMKINVDSTNVQTKFQHILGQGNNEKVQMFLPGDFFYIGGSSTITMILPSGTFADDEIALITWVNEGGTNGNGRLFKNANTTQLNDPDTGTTGVINLSQLGNDGGQSNRGTSSGIIEIAIFNKELTGSDLQNVLSDITSRVGI